MSLILFYSVRVIGLNEQTIVYLNFSLTARDNI